MLRIPNVQRSSSGVFFIYVENVLISHYFCVVDIFICSWYGSQLSVNSTRVYSASSAIHEIHGLSSIIRFGKNKPAVRWVCVGLYTLDIINLNEKTGT